jgi:hypothetical protein
MSNGVCSTGVSGPSAQDSGTVARLTLGTSVSVLLTSVKVAGSGPVGVACVFSGIAFGTFCDCEFGPNCLSDR